MSWRTVNLGELVDNFSVRAKDHTAITSELEFCGVSNEDGITKSKYAAEDKAKDYKIIEKDCFAYNPYRINVGSIGLLEDDIVGLISPAYVVFKPKPKSIIPQLLLKFLKSAEGLRQIKLYARGTVRQALRFEDLCKIELAIPDYEEQLDFFKRIEETEIESKEISTELTHQLDLVKQLRQAFLREAMQGKLVPQDPNDEPASVLLAKIKAAKERFIKEKKIKKQKHLPPITEEEIPFEIPENWVWCRLGEITLYSEGGKSLKGLDVPSDENGWGVIKTSAITSGQFLEMENKSFSNSINQYQNIKIHQGDLLFCRASGSKGLAGKSCIVRNEPYSNLILSDKSIRYILSKLVVSVDYVNCFNVSEFGSAYYLGLGTKKSTTMNNITRPQFDNLHIPLPPLSEQQRIVAKLDELMAYCDELEASIKESQQQNELLLQQVLREALNPSSAEAAAGGPMEKGVAG